MTYASRRRLSLVLLLVWLPLYVVAAVWLVDQIPRLPLAAEFVLYVALGVLWAVPFRAVFRGVGKADPDAPQAGGDGGR
jgi:membrane protein implicated in regulation of membrane protease activity